MSADVLCNKRYYTVFVIPSVLTCTNLHRKNDILTASEYTRKPNLLFFLFNRPFWVKTILEIRRSGCERECWSCSSSPNFDWLQTILTRHTWFELADFRSGKGRPAPPVKLLGIRSSNVPNVITSISRISSYKSGSGLFDFGGFVPDPGTSTTTMMTTRL